MIDGRVGMIGQHVTASLFKSGKFQRTFSIFVIEPEVGMASDCKLSTLLAPVVDRQVNAPAHLRPAEVKRVG